MSIDCASDWGEINLCSLLSSIDELEYSYVSLSKCTWSDLKRSIIHQILLSALRDVADRPDKSVSDAVTLDYTSEIENLLKVYQHYYHDNEADSLHTSYGQFRELLVEGVMVKDELNYDRVRRLLDEHPLEAFKLKVIQFLRLVEDKALPIPRALVGEYDHPEVAQNYSHNTITTLTGASEDTRKKRRLDLLVNAVEESARSSEKSIQTEDLVSNNSVPTATSMGGGGIAAVESANNGTEARFAHYKQDSDDSETLDEIHQRNQKMLELFRTNYLRRFSTDVAPPDRFPLDTATSKLSVIDVVTKSYYPQYREMQRAIARGETSWPFTKEEADRHRAEARTRAERQRAHLERMKAAQYVCDTSDEEEQGKEQEEVEDPGTTHPSTARADAALPRAEASSILSAIDAVTVKYYPQFIEMQQRRLRGEPSWWSFLKEGEDKYIAEARDLAEFEKAEYARVMAARSVSDQGEEEDEEEEGVEGDDDEGDEGSKTVDGEEGGG
eukprot:gene17037-19420_t